MVVYQPAPSAPIMVVPYHEGTPPPYSYTPRSGYLAHRNEWGLNLHVVGALMNHRNGGGDGMGGGGFGLRFKPSPYFGIEGNVDFLGGRDYYDYARTETALTANALVFVNPKDRAQLYFLGGLGWSAARVHDDLYTGTVNHYKYLGAQVGAGVEFRLSRHFALNVDLRGFLRGRTDGDAASNPEFRSASGRTSNSSAGGLLTGGMTIYF